MYQIIGAASGWGAQIRSCEDGPIALKQHMQLEGWEMIFPKVRYQEKEIPLAESLDLIVDLDTRLANCVFHAMEHALFPVVIGGDHSIAIGTWNGVGCFLSRQSQGPLGLIWIDAHMDSHTPQTTPSGAWHGMPLAALLGRGAKELAELKRSKPILDPKHVCLIGVRSFEKEEAKFLKDLNVRIYFMKEVQERGFQIVLQEAIDQVSRNALGYGVSMDIDAIDPKEAPGAGSPEPGGIAAKDLLGALSFLKKDNRLKAFELVEYNPHLDVDFKTGKLCEEIIKTIIG